MPPKRDLRPISRRRFLRLAAGGVGATMFSGRYLRRSRASASDDRIVIYSALNESLNNALIDNFKKDNPQGVDLLPIAAPADLQARLVAEKDAPRADVFIGASSEYHTALGQQGLLLPYRSPNADTIDSQYKDAAGMWTGIYVGVLGLAVNMERFTKEMIGAKKPIEWDDLLAPAWKGNIAFPDPVKTSGGYTFMAAQVFRYYEDALMPPLSATPDYAATPNPTPEVDFSTADYSDAERKAMGYMRRLHNNVALYDAMMPRLVQAVANAQFIGAPTWCHDILFARSQGQPVTLMIPAETGYEVGAISIVKGGPNPDGAMAFVDWALTKEAGIISAKLSNRNSTRPDVPAVPGSPPLDQIALVPYDRVWAANNRARILDTWQSMVGF